MDYKIVADSSHDMNKELESKLDVALVPFKLYLGEEEIIDDDKLDVIHFIERMVKSDGVPRTACPSPQQFIEAFEECKQVFTVTISAALSGTYNAAMLAAQMYKEDHPEAKVHVFDSKSASIGETLISMKVRELAGAGMDFESIVEKGEEYIANMRTFFISESLDNLMKNGRISKLSGTIATVLNIKPIMGADDDGNIVLLEKARGSKKAFKKLLDMISEAAPNAGERTLAISHVNNPDRAAWLKAEIEKRLSFKDIVVVQTKGLSSLYCDNKGIILSF